MFVACPPLQAPIASESYWHVSCLGKSHKLQLYKDDGTESYRDQSQSMSAGGLLQADGPFAHRCQQALKASIPSADVTWPKASPHHAA